MKKIIVLLLGLTIVFSQSIATYQSVKDSTGRFYAFYKIELNQNGHFQFFGNSHAAWDYNVKGTWEIYKDTLILKSQNQSVFSYPKITESIIDSLENETIVQVFDGESDQTLAGITVVVNKVSKRTLFQGKVKFDFDNAKTIEIALSSNSYLGIAHKIQNLKTNYISIKLYQKPYVDNIYHKYLVKKNKLIRISEGTDNLQIILEKK